MALCIFDLVFLFDITFHSHLSFLNGPRFVTINMDGVSGGDKKHGRFNTKLYARCLFVTLVFHFRQFLSLHLSLTISSDFSCCPLCVPVNEVVDV